MFDKKTVFILGAGASCAYGYPLGVKLVQEIITNIENDEIHIPSTEKIRFNGRMSSLKDIRDSPVDSALFKNDIIPEGFAAGVYSYSVLGDRYFFSGKNQSNNGRTVLANPKINNIEEFKNLAEKLKEYSPISIDAFLRDHPSLQDAGKIMIVYSLLKHEDKEKFNLNSAEDNWYSFLLNDILSGCEKLPDHIVDENKNNEIVKNIISSVENLNFLTFNYSVDLDYFLFSKILNLEVVRNCSSDEVKENLKAVIAKKIKHIYGYLWDISADNCQSYEDYSKNVPENFFRQINENAKKQWWNTKRFVYALEKSGSIKIISEEREPDSNENPTRFSVLSDAQDIRIIGFCLDRDNLKKLGFVKSQKEWIIFLNDGKGNNKNIKYMDYEGAMNALWDQFEKINKELEFRAISRSVSKRIIHAYQNDFKIYIFE